MTTAATLRTDFATRLYDRLARMETGNLFLSPFGIQVALAMCAGGARGKTRKVMADLIGAPEGIDEQNREYAELLKSVNGDGKRPFDLATANALWGQQGSPFKSKFRKMVVEFYDGAFKDVDFIAQPDEAVKAINTWVSDKTCQKIKDLIQRNLINQDTRLILTNAIYFKGKWESEFKKAKTTEEEWHSLKVAAKVPMMHQKGDFLYYENDDFQALDLPYKGRQVSMLVVLPRKETGLASLEATWSATGTYQQITRRIFDETVVVSLPRFKMEAEFRLKSVLCDLGADLAFGTDADFSGIGDEPLTIAEVVHKAFVEVNEEGTEAAAASGVVMAFKSAMPIQPKVFKADHPFLFFIRDRNTNAVLFSGRVADPK